jgi:hypothetical protein
LSSLLAALFRSVLFTLPTSYLLAEIVAHPASIQAKRKQVQVSPPSKPSSSVVEHCRQPFPFLPRSQSMSAFVIDTPTMDRAVTAVMQRTRNGHLVRRFADFDVTVPDNATDIGRALFRLNLCAVRGRYPGSGDDLPGTHEAAALPESYRYRHKNVGTIASLKALVCLRYQCSEDATIDDPLYKELDAMIGIIALSIVEASPEYERAPW